VQFCKLLRKLLKVVNQQFLLTFAGLWHSYIDLRLLILTFGRYFIYCILLLLDFWSSNLYYLLRLLRFVKLFLLISFLNCRFEMLAVLLAQELLRSGWFFLFNLTLGLFLRFVFKSVRSIYHARHSVFMIRCCVRFSVNFVECILYVLFKLLSEFLMFFYAVFVYLP